MSNGSHNDNEPEVPLPLHIELAHALNGLAQHELTIGRKMVMVPVPSAPGSKRMIMKPLGEILMRLGGALKDFEDGVERARPRILPATPASISAVVRDIASAKKDTGLLLGGK